MNVLVVDDSVTIQKMVTTCVKSMGHQVIGCANDGEEALEIFGKLKPDFVILDVTMPNKDGQEALIEILALAPSSKVVMLTALQDEKIKSSLLDNGAIGVIDKSSIQQLNDLKAALSIYLNNASVAAA